MNTNTNTNKPVRITTWGEYAKHRRENPDHGWCDKCDCCPDCGCCECKKHPADCECADCEKANPLCQDCRKRPKYDDGVCEKCYAVRLGCDEESEDEEDKEDKEKINKLMGILNTRIGWHETTATLIREVELLRGEPLCRHCELSISDLDIADGYICDKCESDDEDGDWDGDLDDTPNCHECGEDCGRSIIAHQKYKKNYFCSEECNRKYDGEDE